MTLTLDDRTTPAPMSRCSPACRRRLDASLAGSVELDVPADRPIVRQGEIGTGFYIVVSGRSR